MKSTSLVFIALVLIALFCAGCSGPDASRPQTAATLGSPTTDSTKEINGCRVVNYGAGLYYFDCVGEQFGRALSRFRMELMFRADGMTISGNGTCGYGQDCGYWVLIDMVSSQPVLRMGMRPGLDGVRQ